METSASDDDLLQNGPAISPSEAWSAMQQRVANTDVEGEIEEEGDGHDSSGLRPRDEQEEEEPEPHEEQLLSPSQGHETPQQGAPSGRRSSILDVLSHLRGKKHSDAHETVIEMAPVSPRADRPDGHQPASPRPEARGRRKSIFAAFMGHNSHNQTEPEAPEVSDDVEELEDSATIYGALRSPAALRRRRIKILSILAIAVIILMTPGLVCYFCFRDSCLVGGVTLLSWSVLLCSMLLSAAFAVYIIKNVFLFISKRFMSHNNVMYFMSAVEASFANLVCWAVALGLWTTFGSWKLRDGDELDADGTSWIKPLLISFLVTSAIAMIKSIALKLFSLRFLHRAYFERMQVSLFAEYALLQVTASVIRRKKQPIRWNATSLMRSVKAISIPKMSGSSFNAAPSVRLAPSESSSFTTSAGGAPFDFDEIDRLSRLMSARKLHTFSNKLGQANIQYAKEARVMGTELFGAILKQVRPGTDPRTPGVTLVADDLRPFVPKISEVNKVFALFDVRACGAVTKKDMKDAVQIIYRERKNLARSLHDSNSIITTLDHVISGTLLFALVFLYLFIFGVDVGSVLISISSIVISFAFAFGNSLKRIVEAVIFLFVTHAFDVGDRIMINDVEMIVLKIELMCTSLRRDDEQILYYPNYMLGDLPIYNIRRGGNQRHMITVSLNKETTKSRLEILRSELQAWLETQSLRFEKTVTIDIRSFDVDKLVTIIGVTQVGNLQDYHGRLRNRTELFLQVHAIISSLGLFYGMTPPAPQPIPSAPSPPPIFVSPAEPSSSQSATAAATVVAATALTATAAQGGIETSSSRNRLPVPGGRR